MEKNSLVKKSLLLYFVLFLYITFSAQNNSFVYLMSYMTNLNDQELIREETFLDILNNESIFRNKESKINDSIYSRTQRVVTNVTGFENQFYIIKNSKTDKVQKLFQNTGDFYSVEIEEKLNWKILPEKKKIDKFDCQKAEIEYGGRHWTAWFTQDVQLSEGPYIFHGLPGLIVEIFDKNNEYHFLLTKIINSSHNLYNVRKPIPISNNQLKELSIDYFNNPYRDLMRRSGSGGEVIFYDGDTKITPNFPEWIKESQKRIIDHNNPLEINQKINYKL